MKSRLIITLAIITVLFSLAACTSAAQEASVVLSCDDFMATNHISQEVEVGAGSSFALTLCSNPTTGFQWEEAEISDQTVLQEISHQFIGPESEPPPPPGTPGQEVWVFQAVKEGASTVSIAYSRPWEGGEKGIWTYILKVTVK